MVGNVSRHIIAALRNHQFFGLYEVNKAIKNELNRFINRPFQKIEGNCLSAFKDIDKPALKPLPTTRYEYADWKDAKIAFNYHVEYEGFFYSVPYSNIGKVSRICATASTIEIFVDGIRVAQLIKGTLIHTRDIQHCRNICRNHIKLSWAGALKDI